MTCVVSHVCHLVSHAFEAVSLALTIEKLVPRVMRLTIAVVSLRNDVVTKTVAIASFVPAVVWVLDDGHVAASFAS
jgi:hypothetical protein